MRIVSISHDVGLAIEERIRILGERLDGETDPIVRGVLLGCLDDLRAQALARNGCLESSQDAPVEAGAPSNRALEGFHG